MFAGVRTPALGGDLTSVKCKGEWLPLGIAVDPISGLALTIDVWAAQDIKALKEWTLPIAKSVGAEVLVADDADDFKTVADEVGMQHQVCKAHVLRSTCAVDAHEYMLPGGNATDTKVAKVTPYLREKSRRGH